MGLKFSPFRALSFRDYRLFWSGNFISQMGTQMQIVAVSWQMYQLTHSAASLGLIGLTSFLPILFFSLIGGLVADKFNRKKLLIATQLVMAVFAVGLAYTTLSGTVNPLIIYALLALGGIANSFNMPLRQSIIPSLVPREHFVSAVSLNTMARESAVIIGPSIAGFMIELYGVSGIYIFNAVSFLVLMAMLVPVKIPEIHESKKASFSFDSIKEGISFVKGEPLISSTMILDFFATFFASATTLLPIFASDILGTGAKGLGLLYGAPSVGAVITGLIVSSAGNMKHQGKIVLGAVIVFGLATIGFGLSHSFVLSLFFLSIVGASDMVSVVIRNTVRQLVTPDHLRGRMVSINQIFFAGGPQIGEVESGFLAASIGAPGAVVIGGIGAILTTLVIASTMPRLRNYSSHEDI